MAFEFEGSRLHITPRPPRMALTQAEYLLFSAMTFNVWFLFVLLVVHFETGFTASQSNIETIAGSSVELGALTLALLGIWLQMGTADTWLTLGLFFIALLFIAVVIAGFYTVITWQPEFGEPQYLSITIVVFLGFAAGLQTSGAAAAHLLPGAKRMLNLFSLSPFILPLLIPISVSGLNKVSFVVLIFAASLIGLVVLALIVVRSAARQPQKIREAKKLILEKLEELQKEQIKKAKYFSQEIKPVEFNGPLGEYLRKNGLADDSPILENAFYQLFSEGKVSNWYGRMWRTPAQEKHNQAISLLLEIDVILVKCEEYNTRDTCMIDGFDFGPLARYVCNALEIPLSTGCRHVIPSLYSLLININYFEAHKRKLGSRITSLVFLNKNWRPDEQWMSTFETCCPEDAPVDVEGLFRTLSVMLPYDAGPNLRFQDEDEFRALKALLIKTISEVKPQ